MKGKRHILGLIVQDKPGVMQKISGMFTRRNFNIDTITVGKTDKQGISRMTISLVAEHERELEQVEKQLNKLVEVLKISEMGEDSVARELCMVKLHVKNQQARSEILSYTEIFRAGIIDVKRDSITIEIVGDSQKVEAFLELAKQFGIKEVARTGVVAIARG